MRFGFERLVALAAAAVLVGGVVAAALPPGEGPPRARNLFLVVFDTLRADRMSVYGHERETTPFLDSRSSEMVRFDRVEAPAPWTVPSHASMFTGLWPGEHRAQWGHIELGEDLTTLAEVLDAQGFCTVGLTANGFVGPQYGFAQGFDDYRVVRGPGKTKADRILESVDEELARADEECDRLFVFLNFRDTHIPYHYQPHADDVGLEGRPPILASPGKWRTSAGRRVLSPEEKDRHRRAYDAAVRYVDDVAKQLFAELEDHGMLDDSAVVLTSDHGDGLAYHTELGHSISVWEEQLHVPLLVRLPHARRAGEVVEGRRSLVSLAPSALDWLGVPRPEPLRGRPSLASGSAPVTAGYRSYFADGQRRLNARLARRYPRLAERTQHSHVLYCGDLKLVVTEDGSEELYDLAADPTEQHDVSGSRPDALADCRREYEHLAESNLYTPFDVRGEQEVTEADLELLRSLGYVE